MTLEELIERNYKIRYQMTSFKGKSLWEWTKIWFNTDNDTFYEIYGFNFNPHKYPELYNIVRKEIYGNKA